MIFSVGHRTLCLVRRSFCKIRLQMVPWTLLRCNLMKQVPKAYPPPPPPPRARAVCVCVWGGADLNSTLLWVVVNAAVLHPGLLRLALPLLPLLGLLRRLLLPLLLLILAALRALRKRVALLGAPRGDGGLRRRNSSRCAALRVVLLLLLLLPGSAAPPERVLGAKRTLGAKRAPGAAPTPAAERARGIAAKGAGGVVALPCTPGRPTARALSARMRMRCGSPEARFQGFAFPAGKGASRQSRFLGLHLRTRTAL